MGRKCRKCGTTLKLSLIKRKGLPDPVLYCPKCDMEYPRPGEINGTRSSC